MLDIVADATPRPRSLMTPAVQLLSIVGRYWQLTLALFVIFTGSGMAWLARQTPSYEIRAVVAEKKDSLASTSTGLSSLTGGLLGLAQQPSGVKTLQEAMYSAELADRLDKEYHLDREIYSGRWDARLKRWKPVERTFPSLSYTVRGIFGVRSSHDITSADVQQFLQGITIVKSDINTNTSSLLLYYTSREAGSRILGLALTEADALVREQQRGQTDGRLRYLYGRLRQAQFPEQIAALTGLIQRLETQNTVLNADQLFTVDLLSAPRASIQIARPRYTLVFGLIIIAAAALTLAIVWTVATVRRR